jgi:hypothetical protein
VAEVAIVKAEDPAHDRTWLAMADGSSRQVAVHAIHDLPHLVVESFFGIYDGLWGVLAQGGFSAANRARTLRSARRARLVTDAPLDPLAAQHGPGHRAAKAATNAVLNRWQEGPDTPAGVRERLAAAAARSAASDPDLAGRVLALTGRIDDETIAHAIGLIDSLSSRWRELPVGEALHLTWPLALEP